MFENPATYAASCVPLKPINVLKQIVACAKELCTIRELTEPDGLVTKTNVPLSGIFVVLVGRKFLKGSAYPVGGRKL
jgi:hypothetical protein